MRRLKLCSVGKHHYITKASWTRCVDCWQKPPKTWKPRRRRDMRGWRKGPVG